MFLILLFSTVLMSTMSVIADNCSSGWESYNGHCYYFSTDEKKFNPDYFRTCNDKHSGGKWARTVSIETKAENTWIKNKLKEKGGEGYWIGLTDMFSPTFWTYFFGNGQPPSFTDWYPNQPGSDHCAYMTGSDYKWAADYCFRPTWRYICETQD